MRLSLGLLAVSALTMSASADMITIGPFALEGAQEVGPVATPGSGSASLLLDTETGDFTLDYSFSDMLGTVTVAHFHNAPAGSNGGVVYWLAAAGAPNALPETLMSPPLPGGVSAASGSGSGVLSASLVDEVLAGRIYINIHSTSFGGGELRGQVVPGPGAIALAGLGGLGLMRRRR